MKSIFTIVGAGFFINIWVFFGLPAISLDQNQVPRISLQVTRTTDVVDAQTWCESGDVKGSETPLGFNKLRFYREKSDLDNKEYLIGCVTNNSGRPMAQIPVSYNVKYPPNQSGFWSGGLSYFSILNQLQPKQIAFFRSEFKMDISATGVEIFLLQSKSENQMLTYEPQKLLSITRY